MNGFLLGLTTWLAIMSGVWTIYAISLDQFPYIVFASVIQACLAGVYFEKVIRGEDKDG